MNEPWMNRDENTPAQPCPSAASLTVGHALVMLKYRKNVILIRIDNSIDICAIQPYEHTNGSRIDLLSKTII